LDQLWTELSRFVDDTDTYAEEIDEVYARFLHVATVNWHKSLSVPSPGKCNGYHTHVHKHKQTNIQKKYTHTHTHTHTYIYIYIYTHTRTSLSLSLGFFRVCSPLPVRGPRLTSMLSRICEHTLLSLCLSFVVDLPLDAQLSSLETQLEKSSRLTVFALQKVSAGKPALLCCFSLAEPGRTQ
jgi:hypothetical protein